MAHDVFISYSHIDKSVADAVCHHLERDQIRCWMAPRDITPGDEFADAISDALSKSKLFLLIFSSNSNISKYVLREVELAVKNSLTIVTIKIEDLEPSRSMEFYLSVVHWIDAVDKDLEKQLKKLSVTVQNILAAGKTPVLKKEPDKKQDSKPAAKPQANKAPPTSNKKWLIIIPAAILAVAAAVVFIILNPFKNDNNTDIHSDATDNPNMVVEIADKNLESAIRQTLTYLGHSAGDELTTADMLNLTLLIIGDEQATLDLGSRVYDTDELNRYISLIIKTEEDIASLEGLQYAKNLEELFILDKSIRDLTPIKGLEKLTYIDLCGNEITDWSPLNNMSNLEVLVLEDNLLIDLGTLSNMNSLRVLNLAYNQIEDISALKNLDFIESIVLNNNKISNVSALRDMRYLEGIALGSNNLTDISTLQYLKKANWLYLDDNNIHNISPLAELNDLKYLVVSNNNITDLSPLANLENLQSVDVHNNNNLINMDTLPAANLTRLKIDIQTYKDNDFTVDFFAESGVEIVVVQDGEELPIDKISIGYTPYDFGWNSDTIINFEDSVLYEAVTVELERMIHEVGAQIETADGITIGEMFELRYLILVKEGYSLNFNIDDIAPGREASYAGDIHNLEALTFAKNLEVLVLCGFDGFTASGFSPIQDLDSLLVICLPGNNIDNLDFLQNKPNLYYLELSDNNITDISVLTDPALKKLYIAENENVDFTPLDGTQTLEELHIDYDGINDIARLGIGG